MKINYIIFIVLFLITTIVSSCNNNDRNYDALKTAEKYSQETTIDHNYLYSLTNWLKPETKYSTPIDDNINDIESSSLSNYFVKGNRFFFKTKTDGSSEIYSYLDLRTGKTFVICPDPFCPHTRDSGCKYVSLSNLVFSPNSENSFYTTKTIISDTDIYDVICLIDIENNTYTEIYSSKSTNPNIRNSLWLYFIQENKLYFLDTQIERIRHTNGEIENKTTQYYMVLDLVTNEVEILENKYSSYLYLQLVYANDKYIFFDDYENCRFFATDINFKNEQTIIYYGKDFSRRSLYYDKNTRELFFVICSKSMVLNTQSSEQEVGYVYCINDNLECKKVEMPSDKIIEIKLTNKYIYYTVYDPKYYGISPRGSACIDATGNKIYRVSRKNTTVSELVFDGHETLFFFDYTVLGNYIYISYSELVRENNMAFFRLMGMNARVNFIEGTIKWLKLD